MKRLSKKYRLEVTAAKQAHCNYIYVSFVLLFLGFLKKTSFIVWHI